MPVNDVWMLVRNMQHCKAKHVHSWNLSVGHNWQVGLWTTKAGGSNVTINWMEGGPHKLDGGNHGRLTLDWINYNMGDGNFKVG